MNILLTTWCNRRECGFCFEQSVPELRGAALPARRADAGFMSREDYEHLLRVAGEEWRSPGIRLMGGEPTQHPEIASFARAALVRELEVLILTHGVIPGRRARELSALLYSEAGRRLFFLVNPYLRPDQPPAELETIRANLRWMGSAATLSLTATDDSFELEPLAALVEEFGLNTLIRISIAHPMAHGANDHAAAEALPAIGSKLKEQGRGLRRRGIRLLCDCGFVACMFAAPRRPGEGSEAAIRRGLAELPECGILFKSVCRPLLDVHGDLTASHCLPLAALHRVPLGGRPSPGRAAVSEELARRFRDPTARYLYPACEECALRRSGECVAGCIAHRMKLARRVDVA